MAAVSLHASVDLCMYSLCYRSIVNDDVVLALPYKVHGSIHHYGVTQNSTWLIVKAFIRIFSFCKEGEISLFQNMN